MKNCYSPLNQQRCLLGNKTSALECWRGVFDWYMNLLTFSYEAAATINALAVLQKEDETPREYFHSLRAAYFQGCYAPGLKEDRTIKSLFLHNLHVSVEYDMTLHCITENLSMQEICRYA
ncbi:hypothetical protein ILYODFUR_038815 [Ilyodon furcidens]|uniref:Uncharacterized protein n=1 Tax=Ilyodon furcidens TaxID=33524 RepID=A0ABV0TQF4_9TELE